MLGAPGCARSPKENGFDWVLMRLLAGLPVTRADITGLGVGGLLMEIVTRPQPRAEPAPEARPQVAAIVLAAGRSTRMGGPNKLLAEIDGRPLVRIADRAGARPRAPRPVIVVTGHQRERVERALAGLPVTFVHNPDFAEGLSTSLKAGIAAVPAEADGAIVCLGDMPQVSATLIDRLIAAFDPERGALVVVPTIAGKRGNPVLWSRRFFPDLMAVEGDVGARHLIGGYAEAVVEVPVEDAAALTDVDTPEALIAVRAARRLVPFKCFAIRSAGVCADGDFPMRFARLAACFAAFAILISVSTRGQCGRRARDRALRRLRLRVRRCVAGSASAGARAQCKGRDCKVVTSFRRTCAAFAIDGANVCGPHAWAAPTISRARRTSRASSAIATAGAPA